MRSRQFFEPLTKCEVKSVNSRIKEFDLKSPVLDRTLLADELIKARLSNHSIRAPLQGPAGQHDMPDVTLLDRTLLADELIKARLSNLSCAVRDGIRSTIFAGRVAVQ